MAQKMIPCLFMRGGTSRGAYFLKSHLPSDREALDKVLLAVMGSPDPLQIDGLGGGVTTTSKVALLALSTHPGVDIDYHFAQVSVAAAVVDWGPSCGNILAGVGPAALEMGLIRNVGSDQTTIRIRLVNTGSFVEAVVQTPGGQVTYEGDVAIAGVPGTSARIELHFQNVVGSKTGGLLLPTGRLRDVIAGVEVTCIDCGMPIIIARASAMGKTGYETPSELNSDGDFFQNLETIRRIAGTMMGLGDVTDRVIPKFAIVAAPRKSHGTVTARYFVPTATHATMAVTGAISIACCCVLEGTVAYDVATHADIAHNVVIEHPVGEMRIVLKVKKGDNEDHLAMDVQSAGVVRTARLLFSGLVRVPGQELAQVDELEQNQEMNQQFRKLFQGVGKETLPTKSSRTLKASALKLRTRGMPAIRIQARVSGNTHHFNVGPLGRYPSGLSSPGFCYK